MEKLQYLVSQLPPEQLKWLQSLAGLFNDYSNSNDSNKDFFLEIIERKAFYNGYLDLVVILNTKKIEKYFLSVFSTK